MKKEQFRRRMHPRPSAPILRPYWLVGGDTVYLSGQIGLDPVSMEMVTGIDEQIQRVFQNLAAVAKASGGNLSDIVKLNVYLTDLGNFQKVNEIMASYFTTPYPARAAIGVAALPRGALVEMDAVLVLAD